MAGADELSESLSGDWDPRLALVPMGAVPTSGRSARPRWLACSRWGRDDRIWEDVLISPNGVERPDLAGLGPIGPIVGQCLSLVALECQHNQRNAVVRRATPPTQPDRVGLAIGGLTCLRGLKRSCPPRRSLPLSSPFPSRRDTLADHRELLCIDRSAAAGSNWPPH